jgi:peptidylprolyl isomerase
MPEARSAHPTRRLRVIAVALGAAGALALAACSSSPSNSSASGSTTTPTTAPGGGALVAIGPIPAADRSPAGTAGKEPTVVVPTDTAPSHLESSDLIGGTGPEAKAGDNITVQYVLGTYSSGKVIQSSWQSQPFTFTLGVGQVIPGWDKGVVGMKVGGRRELIIPAGLGYGAHSPGPGIAANDTLVFVVDLQSIA